MQRPPAPELVVTGLAAVLLVGSAVAFTNTAGGGGPVEPGTVAIQGFAFGPEALTVDVGATVSWTNGDGSTHTVTGNDGDTLESPDLKEGDEYTVTLTEAGTFEYICKFHPQMQGTITVEG